MPGKVNSEQGSDEGSKNRMSRRDGEMERRGLRRGNPSIVLSVIHMTSEDELKAEIERLRAENESLKKPARGQMSLKVSEKGGLSVYGLGRFPVTLYREQWEKLLGMADQIRDFIRANDGALKKKE